MNLEDRLSRQMQIEGWNQKALSESRIAIIGNDINLTYLYSLSASALGINNQLIINPYVDYNLLNIAKNVNLESKIFIVEGYFNHRAISGLFNNCSTVIDFSNYSLSKKLLIEWSYNNNVPIILVNCDDFFGRIYQYSKGREFKEIENVIPSNYFSSKNNIDNILSIIISGLVLEETKNVLMKKNTSNDVVCYKTLKSSSYNKNSKVLIVGAGALGNFVALGLGYLGVKDIYIMDNDKIDKTNLNRQVLFYNSVGDYKAKVLSKRINNIFNINSKPILRYFDSDFNVSNYDVIFDCVDNFETRIILSEKCKEFKKILISGGTSYNAGQAICYIPDVSENTPAELLGLHDIVKTRKEFVRNKSSCSYVPNPSVIMSNQIIAGIMVDLFRNLSDKIIFYDAESDRRLS